MAVLVLRNLIIVNPNQHGDVLVGILLRSRSQVLAAHIRTAGGVPQHVSVGILSGVNTGVRLPSDDIPRLQSGTSRVSQIVLHGEILRVLDVGSTLSVKGIGNVERSSVRQKVHSLKAP